MTSRMVSVALATGFLGAVVIQCGGSTSTPLDGGLDGTPGLDGSPSSDGANPGDSMTGGDAGPPCTSDMNCAQPTPYCDTAINQCVQCITDTNCGQGRVCNQTMHTCAQCNSDMQCGGLTPYCDPAGQCVECLGNSNCPTGASCDSALHRCVPDCTSDMDCHAPFAHCNTMAGYCVQCLTNPDCATGFMGHVCDTVTDTCVQCLMNTDCPMTRPRCDTMNDTCVQCISNGDCPDGGTCNMFHFCGP